ncbi:MAG: molybdate ABC transporter substrate-binding protein [Oceanospirillaceae bacterium]|nr:molybdate ABC transporter substrate-binding protein [Oceanospirillaceae bacterium]
MLAIKYLRLLGVLLSLILASSVLQAKNTTLFAAASLTQPLDEIIKHYHQLTGHKVTAVYAASSTLARQISHAAPADLYISANQKWMDFLVTQNKVQTGYLSNLLQNRLALIAPISSELSHLELNQLTEIGDKLGNSKMAVGNTDHVPVGIYAKQALQSLQLWNSLKRKLALTANTRGALAFAERAVVPLAIVYKTDADSSKKVKTLAIFPESSHDKIIYPLALIIQKQPTDITAVDFYHYLLSSEAATVFQQFGFTTIAKAK